MFDTKFCENWSKSLNFRRIWIFLFFLSWHQIIIIRCIHEAFSLRKPKSSNVLFKKNSLVKWVRKQYGTFTSFSTLRRVASFFFLRFSYLTHTILCRYLLINRCQPVPVRFSGLELVVPHLKSASQLRRCPACNGRFSNKYTIYCTIR